MNLSADIVIPKFADRIIFGGSRFQRVPQRYRRWQGYALHFASEIRNVKSLFHVSPQNLFMFNFSPAKTALYQTQGAAKSGTRRKSQAQKNCGPKGPQFTYDNAGITSCVPCEHECPKRSCKSSAKRSTKQLPFCRECSPHDPAASAGSPYEQEREAKST